MDSWIQDARKTAINVYLALLLLFHPLYMKEGYTMIGDAKYRFFHNITLFFMAVITVLSVAGVFAGKRKNVSCAASIHLSITDVITAAFLGIGILSWCFSPDKNMAWHGFPGWYMGLLSQMMLVWIYFAVSRLYDGSPMVLWMFWTGAVLVMALGILNCYGYDPLLLLEGLNDWNRQHLRSTIGNQNWYCGYISAASAVGICFGCVGNGKMRIAGLGAGLLFFWTILTQGSEGGYLIVLAEMTVLLLWSLDSRKQFCSFLMISLCAPVAALLGQYCIHFRGLMLVEDGILSGLLFWEGWAVIFVLLAILWVLCLVSEKAGIAGRSCFAGKKSAGSFARRAICILIAAGMASVALCQISDEFWKIFGKWELLRISDAWGNGRGALWRMSLGSFQRMGVLHKLFGMGADCFSHAIYQYYPVDDIMHVTGMWEGAVYANAHNEWLNMLINEGILGLMAYAGIFLTLFVRLWRNREKEPHALLGLLAIAGYAAYGLVSFEQVSATPLMFAVLGMSEGMLRRADSSIMHP